MPSIKPIGQEHRIEQFSNYQQSHPVSKLTSTETKVVKSVEESQIFKTEKPIDNYTKFQALKERVGTKDPGVSVLSKNQLQKELVYLNNLQKDLASIEFTQQDFDIMMEDQPFGAFVSALIFKKFLMDKKSVLETLHEKINTVTDLISKKNDQQNTAKEIHLKNSSSNHPFSSVEDKFNAFSEVRTAIKERNPPPLFSTNITELQQELAELEQLQQNLMATTPTEEEVQYIVTKDLNEERLIESIKSNENNVATKIQWSQRAIPIEVKKLEDSLQNKIAKVKHQLGFLHRAVELGKKKL